MHLLFYFEITTSTSRHLSFKILPENYSVHTAIARFFKTSFCSLGHFELLSCVQGQKTTKKIALTYKKRSVIGKH